MQAGHDASLPPNGVGGKDMNLALFKKISLPE
jgi:hypothetical protein